MFVFGANSSGSTGPMVSSSSTTGRERRRRGQSATCAQSQQQASLGVNLNGFGSDGAKSCGFSFGGGSAFGQPTSNGTSMLFGQTPSTSMSPGQSMCHGSAFNGPSGGSIFGGSSSVSSAFGQVGAPSASSNPNGALGSFVGATASNCTSTLPLVGQTSLSGGSSFGPSGSGSVFNFGSSPGNLSSGLSGGSLFGRSNTATTSFGQTGTVHVGSIGNRSSSGSTFGGTNGSSGSFAQMGAPLFGSCSASSGGSIFGGANSATCSGQMGTSHFGTVGNGSSIASIFGGTIGANGSSGQVGTSRFGHLGSGTSGGSIFGGTNGASGSSAQTGASQFGGFGNGLSGGNIFGGANAASSTSGPMGSFSFGANPCRGSVFSDSSVGGTSRQPMSSIATSSSMHFFTQPPSQSTHPNQSQSSSSVFDSNGTNSASWSTSFSFGAGSSGANATGQALSSMTCGTNAVGAAGHISCCNGSQCSNANNILGSNGKSQCPGGSQPSTTGDIMKCGSSPATALGPSAFFNSIKALAHLPPRPTGLKAALSRSRPWMQLPLSAAKSARLAPRRHVRTDSSLKSTKTPFEKGGSCTRPLVGVPSTVDSLLRTPKKRTLQEDPMPLLFEGGSIKRARLGAHEDAAGTPSSSLVFAVATPQRRRGQDTNVRHEMTVSLPDSPVKITKPNFVKHLGTSEPESEVGVGTDASLTPSLSRAAYFTRPSIKDLALMSEKQLMHVDNFEIVHDGVGSIRWPGVTDVRGLDLDQIVSVSEGTVSVYPGSQPPAGTGLNKNAVISLIVKRQDVSDEQAIRLKKRIQDLTEQAGHTFISYDLETWIFSVPDFEVQ